MTKEQEQELLRMSNKEFFLKYSRMLLEKRITQRQYDALMIHRTKYRTKPEQPTIDWDKIVP